MSKDALKQKIKDEINLYPRKQYIASASLFGSSVREENTANSDVDILVSFCKDSKVGFFELTRLQQFLEAKLGKKVDLVTIESISPYFKNSVMQSTESVYER